MAPCQNFGASYILGIIVFQVTVTSYQLPVMQILKRLRGQIMAGLIGIGPCH